MMCIIYTKHYTVIYSLDHVYYIYETLYSILYDIYCIVYRIFYIVYKSQKFVVTLPVRNQNGKGCHFVIIYSVY